MRYEVLPPRQGKNSYSILYYIKRPHERMPFPFIGSLLDWVRPVLWGSRAEWNAIEVDIDRDKFVPESLNYESSNYSANPLSFETTTSSDLHLPAKATGSDKKWTVTLSQKDNRAKTREIESPFLSDTHAAFAFVNWNGDLDLVNAAKLLGYQSLYPMEDPPLSFLDINTYRKEALDLRNAWLKRRQTGHCYLYFPPRKEASSFKVINLVPSELPSLLTQPA
jgi:hypothetical protein